MNQNDCSGKTLKPWPVYVDHYTLRSAVSRPYYGYVKKAVKDEQPEDLFTVKGSNTNLQPLIEEVGRSYMVVENVA